MYQNRITAIIFLFLVDTARSALEAAVVQRVLGPKSQGIGIEMQRGGTETETTETGIEIVIEIEIVTGT